MTNPSDTDLVNANGNVKALNHRRLCFSVAQQMANLKTQIANSLAAVQADSAAATALGSADATATNTLITKANDGATAITG